MSLQGNVIIWNYSKLATKFPEVKSDDTLKRIIGGLLYDNPFVQGEKVLVSYDGDNLYNPTGFSPYCKPEEWIDRFSDLEIKRSEQRKTIRILRYLLDECYMAEWQVW